jgi:hypothetical protein
MYTIYYDLDNSCPPGVATTNATSESIQDPHLRREEEEEESEGDADIKAMVAHSALPQPTFSEHPQAPRGPARKSRKRKARASPDADISEPKKSTAPRMRECQKGETKRPAQTPTVAGRPFDLVGLKIRDVKGKVKAKAKESEVTETRLVATTTWMGNYPLTRIILVFVLTQNSCLCPTSQVHDL